MPKHLIRTHKFPLTLPETMYSQIEKAAEYDGISQNQLIRQAIIFYLSEGREP